MQDKLFDIGPFTEIGGDSFRIRELPTRPYEKNDSVHVRVSFERDLDKINIERTAYGVLDMLGDVGGLNDALTTLCGLLVWLIQYNAFENYMVKLMYKEQKPVIQKLYTIEQKSDLS